MSTVYQFPLHFSSILFCFHLKRVQQFCCKNSLTLNLDVVHLLTMNLLSIKQSINSSCRMPHSLTDQFNISYNYLNNHDYFLKITVHQQLLILNAPKIRDRKGEKLKTHKNAQYLMPKRGSCYHFKTMHHQSSSLYFPNIPWPDPTTPLLHLHLSLVLILSLIQLLSLFPAINFLFPLLCVVLHRHQSKYFAL